MDLDLGFGCGLMREEAKRFLAGARSSSALLGTFCHRSLVLQWLELKKGPRHTGAQLFFLPGPFPQLTLLAILQAGPFSARLGTRGRRTGLSQTPGLNHNVV